MRQAARAWPSRALALLAAVVALASAVGSASQQPPASPNEWLQRRHSLATAAAAAAADLEEAAIVINSKHSGSLSARSPIKPQPQRRLPAGNGTAASSIMLEPTIGNGRPTNNRQQQQQQPSQEFDSTPTAVVSHRIHQPATSTTNMTTLQQQPQQPQRPQQPINRRQPATINLREPPYAPSSGLIRDTSELDRLSSSAMLGSSNQQQQQDNSEPHQHQNEDQERLKQRASSSGSSSSSSSGGGGQQTNESWMQSMRDNHHGPLRSRFELAASELAAGSNGRQQQQQQQQHLQQQRRFPGSTGGGHVVPVGGDALLLDGHMKTKPGPSQPVPYEQLLLAKSARTDPPQADQQQQQQQQQHYSTRRNSKFTRRSTDAALEPEPTTPLSLADTGAVVVAAATKDTATASASDTSLLVQRNEHAPASTRTASLRGELGAGPPAARPPAAAAAAATAESSAPQTSRTPAQASGGGGGGGGPILVSNNHRATAGGGRRRHTPIARTARKLDLQLELDEPYMSAGSKRQLADDAKPSEQQPSAAAAAAAKSWPRLLPNLIQRTIGSALRRLASNLGNSLQQQPAASNFATSADAAAIAAPPSGLRANFIAAALKNAIASAAAAAAAAGPPNHPPMMESILDTNNHQNPFKQLTAAAAASVADSASMLHEIKELAAIGGLRQHANKKIIDSAIDLPASERQLADVDRRLGLLPVAPIASERRRPRASRMSGEWKPAPAGNGSWTLEEVEPAAEFYLGTGGGANLSALAVPAASQPPADEAGSDSSSSGGGQSSQEQDKDSSRDEQDEGELGEDDQLDFRTTTDSSASDYSSSDGEAADEDAADETLEAADSIVVPSEHRLHDIARDLGESYTNRQHNHLAHDLLGGSSDDSEGATASAATAAAAEQANSEEDNEAAGEQMGSIQDDSGRRYSLFYAPAPTHLIKSYRREQASEEAAASEGEGSFARIQPGAVSRPAPASSSSGGARWKNQVALRRPPLVPIEPTAFTGAAGDEAAGGGGGDTDTDTGDRQQMMLMMVPSAVSHHRRRPSSTNKRKQQQQQQQQVNRMPQLPVSVSLKETNQQRRPTQEPPGRNRSSLFRQPPLASGADGDGSGPSGASDGGLMSPMSSSISVMDLDPSMTRLAHNKLIVAKYKPNLRFKLQKQPRPQSQLRPPVSLVLASNGQGELLRRSSLVLTKPIETAAKRTSTMNTADSSSSLTEMVSRRWSLSPRSTTPSASATAAAASTSRPAHLNSDNHDSNTNSNYDSNSTARAEPDSQQQQQLRIASDFHFLMPGLASGLAARISSLARPPMATGSSSSSSSTAAPSGSAGPTTPMSSKAEEPAGLLGSSVPTNQPYSGSRNDKFNFSLIQMNNRERINPLLFPIDRSNSTNFGAQLQHQRNKPSNNNNNSNSSNGNSSSGNRSRPTTAKPAIASTSKPNSTTTTTTSTTTTTTTTSTTVQPDSQAHVRQQQQQQQARPRPQPAPARMSTRQPPQLVRGSTASGDTEIVGQIVRSQHQTTQSFQSRPLMGNNSNRPAAANRPILSDAERLLRNQYQALIGKNSSLDGRISSSASPTEQQPPADGANLVSPPAAAAAPVLLGHMSLVEEAAHDANRYQVTSGHTGLTSLEATGAAAAANGDEEAAAANEHSIVIMSDNHHHRRPALASRHPSWAAAAAGVPLSSKPTVASQLSRKHLDELVNGTRIRPSSMSKLVAAAATATATAITSTGQQQLQLQPQPGKRVQGAAFNSVQGSPPLPDAANGLMGKLDLRAQELLLNVFDRDPSYSSSASGGGGGSSGSGSGDNVDNLRKLYRQNNKQTTIRDFQQEASSGGGSGSSSTESSQPSTIASGSGPTTAQNNYDRIRTQSTVTLNPVEASRPPPAQTSSSSSLDEPKQPESDATAAATATAVTVEASAGSNYQPTSPMPPASAAEGFNEPKSEPERDMGQQQQQHESSDTNNRASMRKNQAKIQSILASLANKTTTTTMAAATSTSQMQSAIGHQDENQEQDSTTLTSTADPTTVDDSSIMETTRFYAPIRLTTRSHFRAPPMSTPTPGRGAYPNVETVSGSRQKINRPPTSLADSSASSSSSSSFIEYSPTPASTPSTLNPAESDLETTTAAAAAVSGQPTVDDGEPTTPAALSTTQSQRDLEAGSTAMANRRRPAIEFADYPEMPSFPQSKPHRPVIIRRRPTRRPAPQRLAIAAGDDPATADPAFSSGGGADSGGDRLPASNKRRRKRPSSTTRRPDDADRADLSSSSAMDEDDALDIGANKYDERRKVTFSSRPANGLDDGPAISLVRKRPSYMRLPPPDNIRIHHLPNAGSDQQRNRTSPMATSSGGGGGGGGHHRHRQPTAPVSIVLPAIENVLLKQQDHDIRTRPLTIMDPIGGADQRPPMRGSDSTNEAVLNPIILNRIPETTIMHDTMLVSYKPGRPLPGAMSSFGTGLGKPSRPHVNQQQQLDDANSPDGLISSATSLAPSGPTQSSSAAAANSSTLVPQLGSGNGGDTHLISIEQQQREQHTTRRPPTTASALMLELSSPSGPGGGGPSAGNSSSTAAANSTSGADSTPAAPAGSHSHRPIIVINGLFGQPDNSHKQQQQQPQRKQQLAGSSSSSGSSLLEAGSLSVVAQASHGQTNSSRPWYPTAAVSSWPSKHNGGGSGNNGSTGGGGQADSASSATTTDPSGSQTSLEPSSVFGGSDTPNSGPSVASASSPSGSYQNHQLQHNQQHMGMPYLGQGGSLPGSRPAAGGSSSGNQPRPSRWRVRRRPQGNGSSSSSSSSLGGSSSPGYNFSSASSVSNYVYRPLISSLGQLFSPGSFGALFDNVQIFFARIRTLVISLMVMFLPPLALAVSIANVMAA